MSHATVKKSAGARPAPAKPARNGARSPACDTYEAGGEFVIVADLPGVEARDLDIEFHNGLLKLHGRCAPRGPAKAGLRSDYEVTDFARSFPLDENADRDRISADLRAGVLTIRIPRATAKPPRKVAVKGGK